MTRQIVACPECDSPRVHNLTGQNGDGTVGYRCEVCGTTSKYAHRRPASRDHYPVKGIAKVLDEMDPDELDL